MLYFSTKPFASIEVDGALMLIFACWNNLTQKKILV